MDYSINSSNLDIDILSRLRQLIRAVAISSGETRKQTGLGTSQLACLNELAGQGPLSFGQLGERVHLSPSSITKIVDHLEELSLARRMRSQEDRRVIRAEITEKGVSVLSAAPKRMQDRMLEGLALLDANQKKQIHQGLTQLAKLMDVQDLATAPMLDTVEDLAIDPHDVKK